MAKPAVSIGIVGHIEVELLLRKELPKAKDRMTNKATKLAFDKTIRAAIVRAVPVDTSNLKIAMHDEPLRKRTRRGGLAWVLKLPPRAALDISPGAKGYYPVHIEYGYKKKDGTRVAPRSFIRAPVNAYTNAYLAVFKKEFAAGLARTVARIRKKSIKQVANG